MDISEISNSRIADLDIADAWESCDDIAHLKGERHEGVHTEYDTSGQSATVDEERDPRDKHRQIRR